MALTRRGLVALGAAAAAADILWPAVAAAKRKAGPLRVGEPQPFSPADIRVRARQLAAEPFVPPDGAVPEVLRTLTYDQYRDIRFRPDAAIWREEMLPVELQLFHLGHVFADPVAINLVDEGMSRHVVFSPKLFDYGPLVPKPVPSADVGFSGFRLHGPLNRPDYLDEFAVFQGASYFRAIGRGQVYGLSARGLAINTAEAEGEEFPAFREFWIEKPRPGASSLVIHALLDSPSTTGAYRFTIRPGADTTIDVEATLYPRADIDKIGLAPLTSMFYFGPQDDVGVDDFRPAVHDSDGLLMWNGYGEWIWRPLVNPDRLQISAFLDEHPQGFGLMQRTRAFVDFQDLEARYERRPSLWVEPIGDWGRGSVILVEIPTNSENHDNIVAFWRPADPVRVGEDQQITYRLHWCNEIPADQRLARVICTMNGRAMPDGSSSRPDDRLFVVDFAGGPLAGLGPEEVIVPDISTSAGKVVPATIQFNPETGGRRIAFGFDPGDAERADLRCALLQGDTRVSEVWVYRWSA
jgi:glucans biosynthesis protein